MVFFLMLYRGLIVEGITLCLTLCRELAVQMSDIRSSVISFLAVEPLNEGFKSYCLLAGNQQENINNRRF